MIWLLTLQLPSSTTTSCQALQTNWHVPSEAGGRWAKMWAMISSGTDPIGDELQTINPRRQRDMLARMSARRLTRSLPSLCPWRPGCFC